MTAKHSKSKPTQTAAFAMKDVRGEIDALYTPLEEALSLLRDRRKDPKLRVAVAEFHRAYPPSFVPDEPCGFLCRYIASPTREFQRFASVLEKTGLKPVCTELIEDVFRSCNPDKYRLCKPLFEMHPDHVRGLRIMPGGPTDGQKLCDLRLANGTALTDFHHALFQCAFPDFVSYLHDYSEWFCAARRDSFCYLHYLALFICNGILFENFLADDPEEDRFFNERVLPSFVRAVELFGVRPLIVPLLPRESEGSDCWRCLPGSLYPYARELARAKP